MSFRLPGYNTTCLTHKSLVSYDLIYLVLFPNSEIIISLTWDCVHSNFLVLAKGNIYTGNNLFDELGMLEVSFMFVNGNAWTILNLCPLGDNS